MFGHFGAFLRRQEPRCARPVWRRAAVGGRGEGGAPRATLSHVRRGAWGAPGHLAPRRRRAGAPAARVRVAVERWLGAPRPSRAPPARGLAARERSIRERRTLRARWPPCATRWARPPRAPKTGRIGWFTLFSCCSSPIKEKGLRVGQIADFSRFVHRLVGAQLRLGGTQLVFEPPDC